MNNDAQKELLLKLKNQIEENNHYNTRTPLLANNNEPASHQQNQQNRDSPKSVAFTNKLPPVPRRNSKSTMQSNTTGRNRTLSPLSNQHVSSNHSLPRFSNNQHGHQSPSHQMIITTNRDNRVDPQNSFGNSGHLSPHLMIAPSPSLNKKNFYQKI